MLEFKPITAQDRPWVHTLLYAADRLGCEYSFLNQLIWISPNGKIARMGDFFLCRMEYENTRFYFYPADTGDVFPVLEALRQDAGERGERFILRGVTGEDRAVLEGLYPGKFSFEEKRNTFDYIYPVDKLADLGGKKLQAKRNHINKFLQEHPHWRTEEITKENLHLCEKLAEDWYSSREGGDFQGEKFALSTAFENMEACGLEGILLLDGDTPLGFSLGNRITERVFDVNFEKSYAHVPGAYPLVNREFSRYIRAKYPQVEFINREDDMGLEGLRKAKESYHPELLHKMQAVWESEA